ncbi:MAG TPA: DUF2892 domain-containing protein [Casimicrobiaceae bacterium]
MHSNVGGIDRAARIIIGLAVLALWFVLEGSARWWALVGLVPLATGLIGWCPAYFSLGFGTCKPRSDR